MDVLIITDIGAADIDDSLTLMMIPLMQSKYKINVVGIVVTGTNVIKRAIVADLITKELKLNIQVYLGTENGYNSKFPEYLKDNPTFLTAYFEHYPNLDMNKNFPLFKYFPMYNYSKENKLNVICIGPMHDLVTLNLSVVKIYAMGGAQDQHINFDEQCPIDIQTLGYNWGICPEITMSVLNKLNMNPLILISSGFVRKFELLIKSNVYEKWSNMPSSLMTKAIFADWKNCSITPKLMCDPTTFYIASQIISGSNEYNGKEFNFEINIKNMGKDYREKNELNSVTLTEEHPNVFILTKIPDRTLDNLLNAIETSLF